jgi:hypothetical protein
VLTGNGTFTSPNYPRGEYPNNADCEWTLAVEGNGTKMVTLTFMDLDLETETDCDYDYLEVGVMLSCMPTI